MQRLLIQTVLQHSNAIRSVVLCCASHQFCKSPAAATGLCVTACARIHTSLSQRVNTSTSCTVAEQRKPNLQEQPLPSQQQNPKSAESQVRHPAGSDPRQNVSVGTAAAQTDTHEDIIETDPLQDKSIGLYQRFKRMFKQYGKVMIPVHLVTSTVWFGAFYYAAMKGVNVVPFLEFVGLPESIVNMLKKSQSGCALTAYAMYKIATPARYTVTLGGTSYTVKYLRKHGYLPTPPPVRDYIQDKMEETRERFTDKMEETRERLSERMEETKDRFSERMEETKDRITETKDKLSGKLQETKDKVAFRKKKE
ncbi:uncharacterized protein C18orf19 homolog B-like [Acipenser ruthenus]|uniref:uncharacterized protein C18orf19 homolog B-like n=1 Tax=Acipenser ruthenus TaxID=7906 RepID=UPI00145A3E4D|nr:uncharacterized protein C18orf19 homolog B-like [Acipenser ruthenus]